MSECQFQLGISVHRYSYGFFNVSKSIYLHTDKWIKKLLEHDMWICNLISSIFCFDLQREDSFNQTCEDKRDTKIEMDLYPQKKGTYFTTLTGILSIRKGERSLCKVTSLSLKCAISHK